MTNENTYREFKLAVPIWDISDDDGDCEEIKILFDTLLITLPEHSLSRFYGSDGKDLHSSSSRRSGRGDLFKFLGDEDHGSFIAIDMFWDTTDSMNMIQIAIRAQVSYSDAVTQVLQSIQSSAEIASALLHGDLGIKDTLEIDQFPRRIPDYNTKAIQHIHVFRCGSKIYPLSLD